jgi:hypothetical protein
VLVDTRGDYLRAAGFGEALGHGAQSRRMGGFLANLKVSTVQVGCLKR